MWIITESGFISAVAYNEKKDLDKPSRRVRRQLGRNPILARARVKEDLEQLRPFYSKLKIIDMKSSDYQYRALLPRKAFTAWLAAYGDKIDYDSHFKEVVRDRAPKREGRYSAMMAVWSAMEKLQDRPAFSGFSSGSYYSNMCDFRTVKEIKDGGEKVYGTWCSYSKGHKGKHSFEIGQNAVESPYPPEEYHYGTAWGGSTSKRCMAQHMSLGRCTKDSGHGGAHDWPLASHGAKCQHRDHKLIDGVWKGSYVTGSNVWFPCDKFVEDDLDEPVLRSAQVYDNDSAIGIMRSLAKYPVDEVQIDEITPSHCWELWAYCDQLYGGEQMSEAQVAQAVIDCIEDEQLEEYRDLFLEALDEFGWRMVAGERENEAGHAEPSDEVPESNEVPETQGVADSDVHETAVAVEEKEVSS